ncbi:MAG: hypothetical protein K9J17_15445 [Flavobacteriales bacterium]|nr:hypothetical protein [Flavobacteriales bacterium]
MSQAQPAHSFQFTNFKVPEFYYKESIDKSVDLVMDMKPRGEFIEATGEFELWVDFKAYDKHTGLEIIKMTTCSLYRFNEHPLTFDLIPEYFYSSALAITFPFIRAFVSTFTAQAEVNRIVLGLLNLMSFKEELRANTTIRQIV